MSKKADCWIRHNSKQQPVDDHVEVEIRTRGGDYEICEASGFAWNATGEDQIMAYRLHKPVEQVEACSKPDPRDSAKRDSDYVCWMRDRITEIDATTQALTTERAELVQKLASEGFALIGRINDLLTDAAQKHEDMSDFRNWKVGDLVQVIDPESSGLLAGKAYPISKLEKEIDEEDEIHGLPCLLADGYTWLYAKNMRWRSRPSA